MPVLKNPEPEAAMPCKGLIRFLPSADSRVSHLRALVERPLARDRVGRSPARRMRRARAPPARPLAKSQLSHDEQEVREIGDLQWKL